MSAINQSHNPSRNSSFDSRQSDESVLQHPKNREYLEKQGFYKRHEKKTPKSENAASPSQSRIYRSQSLDASERRKNFRQMARSRNFSTGIQESDESNLSEEKSPNRNSRDSSIFRSVTSMEYSDSFESNEGREDSLENRAEMGRLCVPNQNDDWDIMRPAISLGDISEGLITKKEGREQEMSVNDEMQQTQVKEAESSFKSKALTSCVKKFQEMRKSYVQKSMESHDLDEEYNVSSPSISKQSSLENTLTTKEFRSKTSSSCTLKNESLDSHDDQADSVFSLEEGAKPFQAKLSGQKGHVSITDVKIPEVSNHRLKAQLNEERLP